MPTGSHIVIVGESNPHGESPDHALYCWPVNSAGWRLQSKIMGVSRATYIGFHRHNLCVGQWSTPTAREEAQQLLKLYADQTDYTLILLGRKVVEAFFCGPGALDKQGAPKPFTRDFLRYSVLGGHTTVRERENLSSCHTRQVDVPPGMNQERMSAPVPCCGKLSQCDLGTREVH